MKKGNNNFEGNNKFEKHICHDERYDLKGSKGRNINSNSSYNSSHEENFSRSRSIARVRVRVRSDNSMVGLN